MFKYFASLAIVVNCQFDACGKSRSCMMLPDNCTPGPSTDQCNVIMWNTESDGIHVTISGEKISGENDGDWAGGCHGPFHDMSQGCPGPGLFC